eukprot:913982-Pleurochrysis_carterae.AAC.1
MAAAGFMRFSLLAVFCNLRAPATNGCASTCHLLSVPTDRDSFLANKLNAVVNRCPISPTKTRAAVWRRGRCLNAAGCFGGVDQIANASIVLSCDVVVIKNE